MSKWEQALDHQTALLEFWRSPRGEQYAERFAADQRETRPRNIDHQISAQVAQTSAAVLKAASPVAVDREVFGLVTHAAEGLDEVIFHHEDLFTPYGFALLPEDVVCPDARGELIGMRAFSWGLLGVDYTSERTGETHVSVELHLTLYSHIDGPDRERLLASDRVSEATARSMLIRNFNGPLSMLHTTITPFDHPWEVDDSDLIGRWVTAFFILANQRVVVPTSDRASKGARKRAGRSGMRATDDVLVMTLRRPKTAPSKGDGEWEGVDWQHRWMVGGHWRRQWYPSVRRHRLRWIAPHVKGPEDKPLKLHSGRAYEFTR